MTSSVAYCGQRATYAADQQRSPPPLIPLSRRRRRRQSHVTGQHPLLRLFGGGDGDGGVEETGGSGSVGRCSVVLDPIPSVLLDSISVQGSCSAEKAAKNCHTNCQTNCCQTKNCGASASEACRCRTEHCEVNSTDKSSSQSHEWEESLPMISDNEVQGLLQDLVDEEDEGEGGDLLARGQQIDDNDDATVAPPSSGRQLRRRREPSTTSAETTTSKRRKRSTSSSTTTSSSACSATSRRHHHHKHHKHHKRRHRSPSPPPPSPRPRVNPIFVWVKQEDARIVEVHCEEYDKRNRIRLTKTPAGWRAIPRTERFHTLTSPTEPSCTVTRSCEVDREELTDPPIESSTSDDHVLDEEQHPLVDDVDEDDDIPLVSLISPEEQHSMEDEVVRDDEYEEDEMQLTHVTTPPDVDNVDNPLNDITRVDDEDEEIPHAESALPTEAEHDSLDEVMEVEDREPEVGSAEADPHMDNDVIEEPVEPLTESLSEPRLMTENVEQEACVEQEEVAMDEAQDGVEESVAPVTDVPVEDVKQNVAVDDTAEVSTEKEEIVDELPTDLTVPKSSSLSRPPPRNLILRPPTIPPSASPSLPQPAHSHHKPLFLEALLTNPKQCHPLAATPPIQPLPAHAASNPLDLGKSVKRDADDKSQEDITLRNLLSRRPSKKVVLKEENLNVKTPLRVPSVKPSRKSRLLELLTSQPRDEMDPLTQLKKILSDPEMAIPDPLLVPRDRLQDLVTCPAKEIPRLLTLRPELRLPEALAYPSLLQDPNLLVVSLSYLQSLLRSPDKCSAAHAWQPPGALEAINQMMWLPYLTQLEASAMACGNGQEFLNMLNAVFPAQHGSFPAPPGYPLSPADMHAMAMWQEAMMSGMMPPPTPPIPTIPPGKVAEPHRPMKRCNSARTTPHLPAYPVPHMAPPHSVPHPPRPKTEATKEQRSRPTVTCKPLFNLLSSPRREEELQSGRQLAAEGGGSRRLSVEEKTAKLKVKQHLVDPTLRPKLLKTEIKPEMASLGDEKMHSNLWHPLFGSQKASYNSPWQWTTVTVNGE